MIHLTSRTELAQPGSAQSVCGIYLYDRKWLTSKINETTCLVCKCMVMKP